VKLTLFIVITILGILGTVFNVLSIVNIITKSTASLYSNYLANAVLVSCALYSVLQIISSRRRGIKILRTYKVKYYVYSSIIATVLFIATSAVMLSI